MRVAAIRNLRPGPGFSIQNDNNAAVCNRSLILNQLPGKLGFHLVVGPVNHGQSHTASVLAAASAARFDLKATWKFVMWKIYGGGTKPGLGGGYIYTGNEVLHWREFNRTAWASVINIRALLKAASLVSQLLKDVQKKKKPFSQQRRRRRLRSRARCGTHLVCKGFCGSFNHLLFYSAVQRRIELFLCLL